MTPARAADSELIAVNCLKPTLAWAHEGCLMTAGCSWLTISAGPSQLLRLRGRHELQQFAVIIESLYARSQEGLELFEFLPGSGTIRTSGKELEITIKLHGSQSLLTLGCPGGVITASQGDLLDLLQWLMFLTNEPHEVKIKPPDLYNDSGRLFVSKGAGEIVLELRDSDPADAWQLRLDFNTARTVASEMLAAAADVHDLKRLVKLDGGRDIGLRSGTSNQWAELYYRNDGTTLSVELDRTTLVRLAGKITQLAAC